MPLHYANLLKEHGFSEQDPELSNTTLGFLHEIHNTLDDPSIFLVDRTQVIEQPDNFKEMINCELVCAPGTDMEKAVSYFLKQWVTCLRYSRSVHEAVEVSRDQNIAIIFCITITTGTACSFRFTIFPDGEAQAEKSTLDKSPTYQDTGISVEEWRKTGGLTPEQQEDFINGMGATVDDPEWGERFSKKLDRFRGKSS